MDEKVRKFVEDAPKLKEGEMGRIGMPLKDGHTVYIEYHTARGRNVCDLAKKMTDEHYDWKMAGVTNNEEWRRHLDKNLWNAIMK